MATIRLRAAGPRDAADCWERYARPERWREWSPQIRGVDVEVDRLAAGVTGRVLPRVGPGLPFRVTDYDEAGRTWAWVVHVGPLSLALRHRVVERAGGCATDLELAAPLPVALGYAPLARLALWRLVH